MDRPKTAIVCTGGDHLHPSSAADLPAHDLVVAADSGLDLAAALGLHVDVAVGDFDSASKASVAAATAAGTRIERHAPDKDATDLELALDAAMSRRTQRIVVLGADGGRPDHALANLLLLGASRFAQVDVEVRTATGRFHVVTDNIELPAEVGAIVSLLPLGGAARGVRTSGLRFPLNGEDLESGSTRGVSNIVASPPATVSVAEGTLLVVLPEEEKGEGGATP